MNRGKQIFAFFTLFFCLSSTQAAPISFTKLSGVAGGSPANTAIYMADLSGIGLSDILSVTINDDSRGLGGAAGQFSGFDLDAIILSNTLCTTASCAAGLTGLSVFDYINGVLFTPGVQRAPMNSKLFGTNLSGDGVDNAVATLGVFDGNSTTAIPGAGGFVSMGDLGKLSFNLTSALSTAGLYLYIGEVGDNGEVAASSIEVSDRPVGVSEPAPLMLFALAGLLLVWMRKQNKSIK